jgi:hypothetical protein
MLPSITDYSLRVTLNKRQRGILRKAMELSTICGLNIYMAIYDPSQIKLVEYHSHPDFDLSDIPCEV